MEKEFLEQCLGEGLSLEAIGKRVDKHESTISYWLKKHGLEAAKAEKHVAKGAPSKEELERLLAAGLSLREIARRARAKSGDDPPLDAHVRAEGGTASTQRSPGWKT